MPNRSNRKRHAHNRWAEQLAAPAGAERSPAVIVDAAWEQRADLVAEWDAVCRGFFGNMARCAYCGVCALGGKPQHWRYEPALQRDGQALAMPLFAAADANVAPEPGVNEPGAASIGTKEQEGAIAWLKGHAAGLLVQCSTDRRAKFQHG